MVTNYNATQYTLLKLKQNKHSAPIECDIKPKKLGSGKYVFAYKRDDQYGVGEFYAYINSMN